MPEGRSLYAALTFVLAYPLTIRPGSTILPLGSDTDLFLWTLGWDLHALRHQPLSTFEANIFYPNHNTLAYSENLIGSALIAAPVVWLTGNLVLGMNAVALLACVLCGVGAYVLGRRLGLSPPAAVISGVIFAFAPTRFFRTAQLHLATVQWIPFCLASLHVYLDCGQRRNLWWACAFFVLQALTSGHGAVFTVVAVVLLVSWRTALGEPLQLSRRLRDLGIAGPMVLAIGLLVCFPYYTVQQEMGLRRTLSDGYLFAPNAASFLASLTHVHMFLLSFLVTELNLKTAKALLFPGYLTLGLAAVALWPNLADSTDPAPDASTRWWKRAARVSELVLLVGLLTAVVVTLLDGVTLRIGNTMWFSARNPSRVWLECAVVAGIRLVLARRVPVRVGVRMRRLADRLRGWRIAHRRDWTFYAVLAAISLWLALGPQFGLYKLVFWWPGFSFIRVPSRYTILTILALAVMAASGFDRLTSRVAPLTKRRLAVLATVLLLVEFAASPLEATSWQLNIPAVNQWLATRPRPFVVAEFPVADWLQSWYMLYSTVHWQKTIHGYSGMLPPGHAALYQELQSFPDEISLSSLADAGVNYLVIHPELYPPGEWDRVRDRLDDFTTRLVLEHTASDGLVYSLR
jgi:hypothetical protein